MAKVRFNEDGSIDRDNSDRSQNEICNKRIRKIIGKGDTSSEPEPDPEFSVAGCLYGIVLVVVIILIVKILLIS
jgi:hypothetical protein